MQVFVLKAVPIDLLNHFLKQFFLDDIKFFLDDNKNMDLVLLFFQASTYESESFYPRTSSGAFRWTDSSMKHRLANPETLQAEQDVTLFFVSILSDQGFVYCIIQ